MRQQQIILSLGSNIGNRIQFLNDAVTLIHNNLGAVVQVSGVYESPAWGFESDAFLNMVVVMHSNKNIEELLLELQKIEQQLGRNRNETNEYQPRTIDIDVLVCDDLVMKTDFLTIPHPQMHLRKFVLQPMVDLKIDFLHPILQKNVRQLLEICNDSTDCVLVNRSQAPLVDIDLQRYNFVAVEGNIGAGKTTLVEKIAQDFNAKTILERFADNAFLPKFYEDQARFAFPLEMSFLADRYQQLSDDLAQLDLFKDFVVADYHVFKSLIFAKVTLQADEFRLYKTMFDIIYKEMPKPDLYVYLYQPTDNLLQNIRKRGRDYEQDISGDYLDSINQGYMDYIKQHLDLNVLVIDMSGRDFVKNQQDYLYILEKLKQKMA